MKLMKHITIALVLCAIPAMAFGQVSTDCEVCSHVVSVYKGHGGLIATAAEDAEMVTWASTCEGVTRSGTLTPNDDGVVSMLLEGETACYGDDEDNMFEIGPVMDGGWYWLTMENNSAVGGLVNDDVLDNTATMITDAGDGVKMVMGKGAVLLTETDTGRVGLLPNILPEAPMPDATMCGAYRKADKSVSQVASNCMLGDGSTMVRIESPGSHGRPSEAVGSATVYRNVNTDVTVTMDLWTAGGIVTVDTSSTSDPVGTGYSGLGTGLSFTAVTPTVSAFGATPAGALGSGNENLTVTQGDATADPATSDQVTVTIEGSTPSAYCTSKASHDAVVTFSFTSDQTNTLPAPKALNTAGTVHGTAVLTIKCTPPAANLGTNLVPDNPFPTTE